MLARLYQSLLVLILALQLLLAGYMTDVSDDQQFAVHIAELSWFDDDLKQNVAFVHRRSNCDVVRDVATLLAALLALNDLEETTALPAFSKKVTKAHFFEYFFILRRVQRISIIQSLLLEEFASVELVDLDFLDL